jgi:phosphate:Na+ symporter
MFEALDFWKFLAGLGIFMFGMFLLEESIRQISGRTFKRLIKKATTGKFRSILTGIFSTAVLQSSSAVSLMTLAFVGAGIMSMQNGIGVIMGANVGTTITGWIVATLGFKLNIEGISLPLIAIGGLGLIFFSSSVRYTGISKLLVGLGFLFMGLDFMKVSVEEYAATLDIGNLPHYNVFLYVLLGFAITALMQSSSASLAVTLTALHSGVIFFNEATAMVIGANMGTTVTIMLGAIGGVQIKKQVAFSHVFFNFITGAVAMLLLPVYNHIFNFVNPAESNYVLALAVFHTTFNVMGVVLFLPFIGLMVTVLEKLFPEKETHETRFIDKISHDLPEAALHALYQETGHLLRETVMLGQLLLYKNIPDEEVADRREKIARWLNFQLEERVSVENKYESITKLQNKMAAYASNIRHGELEREEKEMIHKLIHISMVLSQVAKTYTGIKQEVHDIAESSNQKVLDLFRDIQNRNWFFWDKIHAEETGIDELKAMTEIQEEAYGNYIATIASLLESSIIKEKHASSLLLINGLITGANRQLFQAVMDMKVVAQMKESMVQTHSKVVVENNNH